MIRLLIANIWCLTLFLNCAVGGEMSKHNYVPPDGYVPNKETAIQIALAVWSPIYGVEKIQLEAPYRAELIGERWLVEGSQSEDRVGGVAVIEIDKNTGRIFRVSHGR
jgi:hypothetical protein